MIGRELLPASQPGCFQSGSYSTGISLEHTPLPSPLATTPECLGSRQQWWGCRTGAVGGSLCILQGALLSGYSRLSIKYTMDLLTICART